MYGWESKHSEFTQARGDPTTINYLIGKFNLKEIISYDEVKGLITTTIQHDQYIRLSDLISLNFSKVIAFNSLQYIQIIIQLFKLLQDMKQSKIQHGNILPSNILLDFTQSSQKLDGQFRIITFQLKLINFAQFDIQKIEDDFERTYSIYSIIFSRVRKYNKNANIWKYNDIQLNFDQFLASLKQLMDKQNLASYLDDESYSWDSRFIKKFNEKYSKLVKFPDNCSKLYNIISELHQYHLIFHHYPELISKMNLISQYNYSNEPQNFIQACQSLKYIFDTIQRTLQVNQQNLKELLEEQLLNMIIDTFNIEQDILIILQQYGYLQNIKQFVEISSCTDQVTSYILTNFVNNIIDNSELNLTSTKHNKNILKTYQKSQMNLKTMVLANLFDMHLICNIEDVKKRKLTVIQSLENIEEIGLKFSKPIIDHYINETLGNQIKSEQLPNIDGLIQFMANSWLMWIDQYIFDQKFSNIYQLNSINNQTFIKFREEQGATLQRQIFNFEFMDNMVKDLLNNFNNNPLINQQLQYIVSTVQANYLQNYQFVKDWLIEQLKVKFCTSLDQNQDIATQINSFNVDLINVGEQYIFTIEENYQIEIEIANKTFNDNWQKIQQTELSQRIMQFQYYNNKLKDCENRYRNEYLKQIKIEPQRQQSQFQNYCHEVFNNLLQGLIQDVEPLQLDILNDQIKKAIEYVLQRYQSLKLKLSEQYNNDYASVDWNQSEKMIFNKLQEGLQLEMDEQNIEQMLNLNETEQQIISEIKLSQTVNEFIKLSNKQGHYYIFDEEYYALKLHPKMKDYQTNNYSSEQQQEVLNTLESDQLMEFLKKILIDQMQVLNWIPKLFINKNGQGVQLVFNLIRNVVLEANGHCSFIKLMNLYPSTKEFMNFLLKQIMQNQVTTQQLMITSRQEYDSVLIWIRNQFKKYISDEYQKVVDENDQLFLEIVHPPNSQDLDQDQIAYLEKQIDNYQKARYLEWLNSRWNKYKEETQKHENIDEDKWKISFYALQSEIEQSISNKLSQLDFKQSLEAQFRKQWIRNCEPKVIVAFVDIFEEWE